MTKLNVIVPNVNMLNFDTVGEVKPHFIGSSTVLTLMDVATRQLPALMNAPSSSVGEDRAIVPYVPASQASDSGRRAKPSAVQCAQIQVSLKNCALHINAQSRGGQACRLFGAVALSRSHVGRTSLAEPFPLLRWLCWED